MPILRRNLAAKLVAVTLGFYSLPGEAQTAGSPEPGAEVEAPGQDFSGDPDRPRRHFRITNSAGLSPAEAEATYADLRPILAQGYGRTGDPAISSYQSWTRYNTAPYASMTHGRRYVSNYANVTAQAYGKYEDAGRLPVGSVLAKDSFVVTEDGEVRPGPLFVMEKMASGFNYVTGDWRYSMITAEGDLAGKTGGFGAQRVEFCIACHLAREAYDHLYFIPRAYRAKP